MFMTIKLKFRMNPYPYSSYSPVHTHNPSPIAFRSPAKVIFNSQPNTFLQARIPTQTAMTPITQQKSILSDSLVSNRFHSHSYSLHTEQSPKRSNQYNNPRKTRVSPTKVVQNSLESSLIYELTDTNITNIADSNSNAFSFSKTVPLYSTKQTKQYLRSEQKEHNEGSWLSYFSDRQEMMEFSEHFHQPTYSQLLLQNSKLKSIIDNEYIPMKKDIDRLIKDQEQREYLVSQLEWKVKQLHKEILHAKNTRK